MIKSARTLEIYLFAIVIFNVLDAMFTLDWVSTGCATEMNPLLSDLVVENPVNFFMVKLLLVSLGILLLWIHRNHRLAIVAILIAFVAYGGIVIYHLSHGALEEKRKTNEE